MLVQFKGIRDRFIRELLSFRHFFERNVTGYTYLFFAQTSFLAENIYWRYQLKGTLGKTPLPTFAKIEIPFYYSLPLFFVIAAFLTFKYPKAKSDCFLFVLITVALS